MLPRPARPRMERRREVPSRTGLGVQQAGPPPLQWPEDTWEEAEETPLCPAPWEVVRPQTGLLSRQVSGSRCRAAHGAAARCLSAECAFVSQAAASTAPLLSRFPVGSVNRKAGGRAEGSRGEGQGTSHLPCFRASLEEPSLCPQL